MKSLDDLLDKAASDVRANVRTGANPDVSTIRRRTRRRTVAIVVVPLLLLVGAAVVLAVPNGVPVSSEDGTELITSVEILEDGVVTEAEYTAGAEAVVACLQDAGLDAEVIWDDPSRHASFLGGDDETTFRCFEKHLSHNVSLGWSAALGQLDLDELREEAVAVFGCVEARTGEEFGELTYDEFGYLTEQGQLAHDAAFEYQDHEPWAACRNELGYDAAAQAETEALVECVEEKTGEDFGELSYDEETGQLTEEGHLSVRNALSYQDHGPWEACQQELGFWPYVGDYDKRLSPQPDPGLIIVERSGLSLVMSGPLDGPCLEVKAEGGMSGGCGLDLSEVLNAAAGSIDGVSFVYGWVRPDAAKVRLTLADGSTLEVADSVSAENFDLLFFLKPVSSNVSGEPDLPISVVALGGDGEEIARYVVEVLGG